MKIRRFSLIALSSALIIAPIAYAQAEQAYAQNNQANLQNTQSSVKQSLATGPAPEQSTLDKALSRIKINGFLSAGMIKSTSGDDYVIPDHGAVKNTANFNALSLAGIQFQADITKQLSAVVQLIANGDNTNGNSEYQVKADWAYINYAFNQNIKAKAGRFRIPLYLYSDTLEVGYNYVWTTLPNEVYRVVPFSNMNGVELAYTRPISNSDWNMTVMPFFGQNNSKYDFYDLPGKAGETTFDFTEDSLVGAEISFGNPSVTLRASYAQTSLTGIDDSYLNGAGNFSKKRVSFYGFGEKSEFHNFITAAEYTHRSSTNTNNIAELTGYYVMAGYKFGKWIPNFTYAKLKTDNTGKLTSQGLNSLVEDQRSLIAGVAYYMNSHLVLKGSVSRISPQNGSRGLFDTLPNSKNIYLYSLALNATF